MEFIVRQLGLGLDLALPVGVVNLALSVGVVNLASPVGVVNLASPVGVVNLVQPVGVVNLAVNFAKNEKQEICGRTTHVRRYACVWLFWVQEHRRKRVSIARKRHARITVRGGQRSHSQGPRGLECDTEHLNTDAEDPMQTAWTTL